MAAWHGDHQRLAWCGDADDRCARPSPHRAGSRGGGSRCHVRRGSLCAAATDTAHRWRPCRIALHSWVLAMLSNLGLEPFETPLAVPGYPWMLVYPLELADGAALRLRPIRPDDEPRLVELFHRLSPRTVYQRFFRAYDRLPDHWYRSFANVDYHARLALVADEPRLTAAPLHAVARYEPGP